MLPLRLQLLLLALMGQKIEFQLLLDLLQHQQVELGLVPGFLQLGLEGGGFVGESVVADGR